MLLLRSVFAGFLALSAAGIGTAITSSIANAHDFGGTTESEPQAPEPDVECCKDCGACEPGGFGGGGGAGGGGGPPPGFSGGVGGDPLWFYDGRLFLNYTDLSIGDLFPIALTRQYRNVSEFDSALGYGWAFVHDQRLFEYPDGSVVMRIGSGRRVRFVYTGGAFVTPNDGLQGELTQLGNGSYVFRRADAQVTYFDADGRLTAIQNRSGHRHEFLYDVRGSLPLIGTSRRSVDPTQPMVVAYQPRLTQIQERSADGTATGATIDFHYDETTGRLTHIITNDGRRLDYTHDAIHGNLTGVSGLDNFQHTYAYADAADAHNLTTLTPGLGAQPVVNTYDSQDRITRQMLGAEIIDIAYPTATTRTVTWTIKDAAGVTLHTRVHTLQYTGADLVKETNALGHELRQIFNAARDMTRQEIWQKPAVGALTLLKATDWTYDGQGRQLTESVTLDSGEVVTTAKTYDQGWLASTQTTSTASPQLFRTEYTFARDTQGVPVSIATTKRRNDDGSFATTTYAYCSTADVANPAAQCPFERLLKSVDGPRTDVADVTTYAYYTATDLSGCGTPTGPCHRIGQHKQITNALGQTSTVLAYDTAGRVARTQEANGIVTATTYHLRGWPLTRTLYGADANSTADDAVMAFIYDARGNLVSMTDPDGVVTSYVYDARNRLLEMEDASGGRLVYTYDSEGQRLKEEVLDTTDVVKRTRSFGYDKAGQLIVERDAQNRPTQYEYDALGRRIAIIDALNHRTTSTYDDLDRLTKTIADATPGGLQVTTQFVYDAAGNLRRVTDPKGLFTDYTYNAWGQLTQLSSPDTGLTTYTYDAAGNRLTQTDARGVPSTYTFDAINRLVSSEHGDTDPQTVSYEYDLPDTATTCADSMFIGRLSRMTDSAGTTTYCYDRHGNSSRKTQQIGLLSTVIEYDYTLANRLAQITYPSGALIAYGRDGRGRISSLTEDGQPLVTAATYLPFGPLMQLTFAGGASQTLTYDANYAIDAITGTALTLDYSVDALGNVVALPDATAAQARTYEYDALSRLKAVKDGSAATLEAFTYDATGNRLSKQSGATTQTYGYPATSHQLTSVAGTARIYDEMGNLTGRGDGWTFEYDARQRLAVVSRNGTLQRTNLYNGKGERVHRVGGGILSAIRQYYAYDEAGQLLADYQQKGSTAAALQKEYIWLDNRPVGFRVLAGSYSGETLQLHADHLGTPRAATRPASSNAVVWAWELRSTAFGEHAPNTDPDGDGTALDLNLRYPGQYYDIEGALHYNYFRNYEPSSGRYMESDPIGLGGGGNTYAYSFNTPTKLADPSGLNPGDKFKSPHAAAVDAIRYIFNTYPDSSSREYCGWIKKVGKCYVADPPHAGSPPDSLTQPNAIGECRLGQTPPDSASWYHNHLVRPDFSNQDKINVEYRQRRGYSGVRSSEGSDSYHYFDPSMNVDMDDSRSFDPPEGCECK